MDLNCDIRYIKGIGETRAKSLKKLGIETLGDMVSYFPRAYEDRSHIKTINQLVLGETVCVSAMIASEPRLSHIRKGLDLVKVRAVDSAGELHLTFFNQPYVKDSLEVGREYIFYGKVGGNLTRHEMTNPVFEKEGSNSVTGRIMPIYPLTAGISQNLVAKAVLQGLNVCGDVLPDPLPDGIRQKYKLAQSRFAYENIHFPASFEELYIARKRLIFEELFVLCCAMSYFQEKSSGKTGLKIKKYDVNEFYSLLPFELTGAQKRAIADAVSDMESGKPMNRLVQGDVGSGKTMVAAAACAAVCRSGYQAAIMAPTELLAEQHYRSLAPLFEKLGLKTELLCGSLTAKQKREIKSKLILHEADIVIGTHALISDDVEYAELGLVVADEQHRFGVSQRSALTGKGDSPHVLVMSATPIPRTLALIVYSDLEVSVIDELPPGRQKVDTFAVGEGMRQRIYNFIRKQVQDGRQVYIVCPAVEESPDGDGGLKAAKEYSEFLAQKVFPDLLVAFVHGKMKAKEKDGVMLAFSEGKINILVATTVVEVGVDVPNATLMVVENADRFGLSQLHQLRGRVGRGEHKSYCVLFEGTGGENVRQRLKAMCDTNNGFKIAEMDLAMRGPGDFFGSRQHGLPQMKIADFASDMEVLTSAKEAAVNVMKQDPELVKEGNRRLKEYIAEMIEKGAGTFN